MDENKKAIIKKIAKIAAIKALPFILIPLILATFFGAIGYYLNIDDGTNRDGDWSSTPYAASTYTGGTTIDKDGTIKAGTTAEELWNKMIKNGSRVNEYLDNPKELARLMKAEIVTQYPDTRKNPDKEIKWKDIIENEDELQGIVKFKRTDENNQTSTMTYVDPETFQGYIDEYNGTGSESAKKNALTHFTLRRSTISTPTTGNNGGGNSGDNVDESKLFFVGDSWIDGLKNSGVAKSTKEYFYGVVGISAKDSGMSPATVISKVKDDASAIVLYLGVNGTGTYGDMNKLVDELANKYSNKTIYVVQVSHVDPNKYTAGFANNNDIDKYNENVKSHCEQVSNAKFLEVASSVQDDNGNLKNTSDGLHLNNYQDWYNSIITAINGNGGQTTTSAITKDKSNDTRENDRTDDETTNNQGPKDTQVDGDGYTHEYTSSAGITYKCYKQGQGSYSTQRYWRDNPNGTIASSGCGPTSVAILTSGLKDPNITPSETASSMYERHRIYRG